MSKQSTGALTVIGWVDGHADEARNRVRTRPIPGGDTPLTSMSHAMKQLHNVR